jgi:hypothetical protein
MFAILPLADHDGGAVRSVGAFDGGCLGGTAVHGHRRRDAMPGVGMRPLQAHCHRGLDTLYAATGQREQARAELTTAINPYRAMEMMFWLPQADVALAQVDAQ